jgi:UDP-glucose 4-epimerase
MLQLLAVGFRVIVIDNLQNSSELSVRRVAALAWGAHEVPLLPFYMSICSG